MNLQEALANLTGVTSRLEALSAARDEAAQSLITANSRIVELEGLLAAAPKPEAIAELQGQVSLLTERATNAELALKAEQDEFPVKLNAEVAKAVAANGFQGTVETVQAKKNDDPEKPDLSNLTGIAKVAAAFAQKKTA